MISEMAMDDIEDMIERGLTPSPRDIIRLNALGLKCDIDTDTPSYILPRVAFMGALSLREPSVAHHLWIDRVETFCCRDDLDTSLVIKAFAFSRPADALPDALDRKACISAIDTFVKTELAPFTPWQIRAAVIYAEHGPSALAMEYPEPRKGDEVPDGAVSIGAGALIETLAMGLGLSIRDISHLPISRVRYLQDAAMLAKGVNMADSRHKAAVEDYFATRQKIEAELAKKKEDK